MPSLLLLPASQYLLRVRQLASARWWQELLHRSICSFELELQSLIELGRNAGKLATVDSQVSGHWKVARLSVGCPATSFFLGARPSALLAQPGPLEPHAGLVA